MVSRELFCYNKLTRLASNKMDGSLNFDLFYRRSRYYYFNSFADNSAGTFHNHCTFNPLDKLIDAYDENKKLYERLLESEKEKNAYLEKLLKDK